jgi:REP element-mobilizing transposase RayT
MYHRRKSLRIPGFDYTTPGYYFVTICLDQMKPLLGSIRNNIVFLTPLGNIIQQEWEDIPTHYTHTALDEFIIMPNHIHGIIEIFTPVNTCGLINSPGKNIKEASVRHSLTEIVRGFKTWSARKANRYLGTTGSPFWMRSFYDHVIRTEKTLHNIRHYIKYNPNSWNPNSDTPF